MPIVVSCFPFAEIAATPRQKRKCSHTLVKSRLHNRQAKGGVMNLESLFDQSVQVSCPPSGSVNVRIGNAVEGPGGRWVPCASAIADGAYVSCVYEVGPGRRQVCAATPPTYCAEEALSRAIELADTAAA